MDVVVINLERSAERRAHMTAQLAALGLDFSLLRAVDASAGEHRAFSQYDPSGAFRALDCELTPGEIGCLASHFLAWRRCAEAGRPLIVMEDDAVLDARFRASLSLARRWIDRYGLIRLSGNEIAYHRVLEKSADFSLVRFRRGPSGCTAYALSPTGARALIDQARTWVRPVDLQLGRCWENGLAPVVILPFPVRDALGEPRELASILDVERRAKPAYRPGWRVRATAALDHLRRHRFLLAEWCRENSDRSRSMGAAPPQRH
jgi:glycosyl transferase family 25